VRFLGGVEKEQTHGEAQWKKVSSRKRKKTKESTGRTQVSKIQTNEKSIARAGKQHVVTDCTRGSKRNDEKKGK